MSAMHIIMISWFSTCFKHVPELSRILPNSPESAATQFSNDKEFKILSNLFSSRICIVRICNGFHFSILNFHSILIFFQVFAKRKSAITSSLSSFFKSENLYSAGERFNLSFLSVGKILRLQKKVSYLPTLFNLLVWNTSIC